MNRKARLVTIAAVVAISLLVTAIVLLRRPPHRREVFRRADTVREADTARRALAALPPAAWTSRILQLQGSGEWSRLAHELAAVRANDARKYENWHLGYLHARAMIEADRFEDAEQLLEPYLAPRHRFRDLALHHRAEIADADDPDGAAHFRQLIVTDHADSPYRELAIDALLEYYSAKPQQMLAFGERLRPRADTARRREIDARQAEALWRIGAEKEAIAKALVVLRGEIADDPADRAARILDRKETIAQLPPADLVLVAQSSASHRNYDRAVQLLGLAMQTLPAKRDDLQFQIGRAHFGAERFDEAMQAYLRGASTTDAKARAQFLHHAARCAQLLDRDVEAEQLATKAIAVPGRFPSTSAALMLRLRSKLARRAFQEAAADLAQIRRLFPDEHDVVDASLALAIARIAAGSNAEAVAALNAIPKRLTTKFDDAELTYWMARAVETSDPAEAVHLYLTVLRAPVPTHFAYFARERLRADPLAKEANAEAERRGRVAQNAAVRKEADLARSLETDAVLLSPPAASAVHLQRLSALYADSPRYSKIATLSPSPFPQLPLKEGAPRAEVLLSLGLFDDAVDQIPRMYPLRPLPDALAQSLALNLGSASKPSIFAIEVLTKSVPSDYLPQLLPRTVQQLLYPRYFYEYISEDARKYGADPRLVLSIMREESRFNARAKSVAAARGLLQFIITTARDVGRALGIVELAAEDLYDPRIIIQLGAKYIASLLDDFDGNRYRASAAYNAGPVQVKLWSRLSPAPGDDFFLSTINFAETKDYVRKVQNSYHRYGEIYDKTPPVGGTRPEP